MFAKIALAFQDFKTKLHSWGKGLKRSGKLQFLKPLENFSYLLCVVILIQFALNNHSQGMSAINMRDYSLNHLFGKVQSSRD